MRTPYRAIGVIMLLALTLILGVSAVRAQPGGGNCPSGGSKTNTSDGSIFIDAGTVVCVKASNNNTGKMTSTGETLAELIIRSGLLNNGDQVPNVSNYVVYGVAATPTPSPSFDPCDAELAIPELTADCPAPSETPVPSPTSSIDVPATMTPTPAPTASDIPNTGLPYMVDEGNHENDFNWFAFLLIAGSMGWMIQRAVEAKKESE